MATSGLSSQPISNQGNPLTIVLLGATGVGKSATGNTLLGTKTYKSSLSLKSCTEECNVAEVDRFGTRLVVVDTPGVLDTAMSDKDIEFWLRECTHLACPGVHAFLFLMKIGDRDILGKDKKTFDKMKSMFGEEFLDYTIVVFTAKEELDDTLDQYFSDLPDTCRSFILSCKGGYIAVSNKHRMEQSAEQVVDKVKHLVQKNDGGYYKSKLFDKDHKKIRDRMACIIKLNECIENEIKEAEREKQNLIASYKDYKPTTDQIQEVKKKDEKLLELQKKLIDRKTARQIATSEIKFEDTVNFMVGGAAVIGGILAAVATGGIAGFAVAGPVIQAAGAAVGTIAGTTITGAVGTAAGITAGTTVGTAVGGTVGVTTGLTFDGIVSYVVNKFRGYRVN